MSATTEAKATPGAKAVAAGAPFETKAAEFDRDREQVMADLEQLEASAGAALLDDPDTARALPGRVAELRARADMAGRGAVEARRRAQDARVASLLADADALTPEVAKARKALAAHDEKREKLRAALVDFTGLSWVEQRPDIAVTGPYVSRDVRGGLVRTVQSVQARQDALRADADAAAADPSWMPAQEREQLRLRESWDEALTGYRECVARLAGVREEVTVSARATSTDLEDVPDPTPRWLSDLREQEADLSARIEALPNDVDFFRRQGLDLSDEEVSAVRAEFGLTDDPAGEAVAVG